MRQEGEELTDGAHAHPAQSFDLGEPELIFGRSQRWHELRRSRRAVPGGRFGNINLLVVRENLEGLCIGHEHFVQIDGDPHAVAMATGINTRAGSRRLLEFAFEHAMATGRKKVTIVHKPSMET